MNNPVKHNIKVVNNDLNPCFEEGELSKTCMKKNSYDSEKCSVYFENYKTCKKFWYQVKRSRMSHGIEPNMPDKEERKKIMKERERGNKVYQCT